VVNDALELVEVDWLDEVMLEPRGDRSAAVVLLPVARDGDEAQILGAAAALAEALRELVSIHDRETEIQERDARVESLGDAERGRAIVRHLDDIAERLERVLQRQDGVFVVIDDEDALRARARGAFRGQRRGASGRLERRARGSGQLDDELAALAQPCAA